MLNYSPTVVRGARSALALHRKVSLHITQLIERVKMLEYNFNGEGGNYPNSPHTMTDMVLLTNISGRNLLGHPFWLEIAITLDESAIPVLTIASSLNEEVILFLPDLEESLIFSEIDIILESLPNV